MARTEEGGITPPPATNEAVGAGGKPTEEDLVNFLVAEFGDQYPESYEEGKRNFCDALVRHFGIPRDTAADLVNELEQTQTIRFHRQSAGSDVEVPRVGLFDTPETVTPANTEREFAGRYWAIGRREVVPGAL